jgi:hypothetical protein
VKLTGKELELPPVLNDWLPYDDVANSASACVGWVVRKYDYETGFEVVGVELSEQIETRAGDVIPHADGARKIRWTVGGSGKRGGDMYSRGGSRHFQIYGFYNLNGETYIVPLKNTNKL